MKPELEIQSYSQSEHYHPPAKRFENQVALVVGGAQGIGRAIALRLAREGAETDNTSPLLANFIGDVRRLPDVRAVNK